MLSMPLKRRANTTFQPTRCASLAFRDRSHFDTITDLSMLYPRSERLNAGRSAALIPNVSAIKKYLSMLL